MEKILPYAYFYPQTTQCRERSDRARSLGYTVLNESEAVMHATPLFDGHDQPKQYSLGTLDKTIWDDSDPSSLTAQSELARTYNIAGFIFDSYAGFRNGRPVFEMSMPLQIFSNTESVRKGLGYAIMWVMSAPRVKLPVQRVIDEAYEPSRDYELSAETAKLLVDISVQHWENPSYLHIMGRPYCGVFPKSLKQPGDAQKTANFLTDVRSYSEEAYNINPYIIGIERHENYYKDSFLAANVDAVSAYALLPNFAREAKCIQIYSEQADRVRGMWERMRQQRIHFIPSAVVGWDASPRGEPYTTLEEVASRYPFTPIVVNNDTAAFEIMLRAAKTYVEIDTHISQGPKIIPICAFNEISEGCALLPRIIDGELNFSALEAVKKVFV